MFLVLIWLKWYVILANENILVDTKVQNKIFKHFILRNHI